MNRSDPGRYVPVVADLWTHETRRAGPAAVALPIAAAVVLAVLAPAIGAGIATEALAAYAVPLVAGLAAAAIVAGERMVELHLTLPTVYPTTVARRLVLLSAATLAATGMTVGALGWAGTLTDPGATAIGVAAFAAAMIGVAAHAAARSGSAAGACAMVFAAWLGKILFVDRVVRSVPVQAVLLLVIAAVSMRLAMRRLAECERQLRGEAG